MNSENDTLRRAEITDPFYVADGVLYKVGSDSPLMMTPEVTLTPESLRNLLNGAYSCGHAAGAAMAYALASEQVATAMAKIGGASC